MIKFVFTECYIYALKAQQADSLLYILWSYHTHSLRSVGKIQGF